MRSACLTRNPVLRDSASGWYQHADQFHLSGPVLYGAIQRVADSWKNPPGTVNDVLDRLERTGLVETAALLRRWKRPGWP